MPHNAAKTEPKSRTRTVSLRIPDNTYTSICRLAAELNISPSKLLTYIVTHHAQYYTLESMSKTQYGLQKSKPTSL